MIKKLNILIADDNKTFTDKLAAFLSEENYSAKIYKAYDGEEAWTIFQAVKPDVVILDIVMPKLDGIGFLNRFNKCIEEEQKNTAIICLSLNDQYVETTMNLGAKHFLLSPCTNQSISDTIKSITLNDNFSKETKTDDLEKLVIDITSDMELCRGSENARKYCYLIDAIMMVVENGDLLNKIEDIYTSIANKYKKHPIFVRLNIDSIIEETWERRSLNPAIVQAVIDDFIAKFKRDDLHSTMSKYPYCSGKKLTSLEFIEIISNKIKSKYII